MKGTPRVPSVRSSLAVLAVIAANLESLLARLVDSQLVPPPQQASRSASAVKMARHRARNPNCQSGCCASHRKQAQVPVPVSGSKGALRGEKPRPAAVMAGVTGNPSLPRSPSLPKEQKQKRTDQRPSAAKRKRGPVGVVGQLASFWGRECKRAGVSSLLGGSWKDLKTLLFAVCGGNLDRAYELVGPYIHQCGNTKQTPSVRELLDMAPKARAQNGATQNGYPPGTAVLQISDEAKREHATPGRKGLTQ